MVKIAVLKKDTFFFWPAHRYFGAYADPKKVLSLPICFSQRKPWNYWEKFLAVWYGMVCFTGMGDANVWPASLSVSV
jgi:hypothetical protein